MDAEGITGAGQELETVTTAELPIAAIPAQIGRYTVEAEIGNGTLIKLFRASDRDTQRPVLLRVLTDRRQTRLLEVFRREVAVAARLYHRNVIAIYELGEHAGLPFAAMPALAGGDLLGAIQSQNHLTLLQKVTIMWHVAEGLRAAHRGGLAYVGVRPSGIVLPEDGSAVIRDFSIVRLIGEDQSEDLSYASPEELHTEAPPDSLSDVFAFGTIYYELLTGAHPHGKGAPAPLRSLEPQCPEALERLVHRAFDSRRERRYQSMDSLQEDAEPILYELKRARAATLLADVRRMQGSGEMEQAHAVVREVLELDPSNRKARQVHSALRAEQQRRLIEARVRALLQEAEEEAAVRRFARAVEILHSASQLEGSGPEVARRLEEMCARLERSQNACQLVADARQLLVEENFAEALEKASRANELDPEQPDAAELLSAIAEAQIRREREARIQEVLAKVDALFQTKDYPGCVQILLALRDESPGSQAVDDWLARVEKARVEHERQVRREEKLSEIRSLMAGSLFAEAISKITVLADEFPEDPVVADLLQRARAEQTRVKLIESARTNCATLRPQGEHLKALEALDEILALYPDDSEALALRHEVEQEWQALRSAAAADEALTEAEWLLSQERPHIAARFLREKSAVLPGRPELLDRLEAIERMIPQWENRRFVQDCLSRAAALEQSEQWLVALTLIEQALETSPASPELHETADRLRRRRHQEELRKKLASRLEAIHQKLAAEAWAEVDLLIEAARAEFPGEPAIERHAQAARAARGAAQWKAVAADVRQYLAGGEPEKAEALLQQSMQTLPAAQAPEELWLEVENSKWCWEQWRMAKGLFARRQWRAAEDALLSVGEIRHFPEAQALLEAVHAARAAGEKDDFFERGREQASTLMAQQRFEQAIDLIRNLLAVFPSDPTLMHDLETAEAGLVNRDASAALPPEPPAPIESAAPVLEPAAPVSTRPPGAIGDHDAPRSAPRFTTPEPERRGWTRYVAWPVIATSLVVLVVSATATVWKLTRPAAQAASPVARPPQGPVPPPVDSKPTAGMKKRAKVAPTASVRTPLPARMPANRPAGEVPDRVTTDPPAILEPKLISNPAPVTPPVALQRGLSGPVQLEATVDQTGAVRELKVVSGDAVLAAAATSAVSRWRYEPGTLNGRPIAMKVQIQIVFGDRK